MDIIYFILEFLKDPLTVLTYFIANYGLLVYIFLFIIIFVETGVVVMPLLPGDSLLFAIGLIANSTGEINIFYIIPILILAALLGDNLNYFIGKKFGDIIQSKNRLLFLKKEHIEMTEKYFEQNGTKTIVLARFVPIIRTVAPFVAGAGEMKYKNYLISCILGAFIWVVSITSLGYFFGSFDIIKQNFDKVIVIIVLVSILPILFKFYKSKK